MKTMDTQPHNDPIIVGLDIGTTKIVAMVGRLNEHGKLEILGYGKADSIGVQRGVVTHIPQTTDAILKAVQEAERVSGVEIKSVITGIAGQHIRSYQHRGILTRPNPDEEITQKDIDTLIENMYRLAMPPGEEIIHVLPQEYVVDTTQGVYNPIGMLGSQIEANFHIVTGHVSAARNISRCITNAGLTQAQLILEPIASAEAVLHPDEKEAGVALIDIGGGTTDIAIFHESRIRHTAVIPLGGNIITEDIRAGCNIIRDYAERLKVQHGSALALENLSNKVVTIPGLHGRPPREISLRTLAGIIQARMEEILEYVMFEIKQSGFENKLSMGMVLTGGGALLKNIRQLAEYVTGMEVRIGSPREHLANSPFNDKVANPVFATSIGLVMMGLEEVVGRQKLMAQEQSQLRRHEPPATHSHKQGGRFFEILRGIGREFFGSDEPQS
ncbi:MAG: cell division protein FtsA [Flavobacteriales bacterium]|nr:cell division protein FtsA [Flavobacteriales bacterium]MCX7768354.1 cell division protein FtsA [Flavobacteriales bacterium]MDW8409086.1 cell division protein FtsA [Flavobacteriales bacterium]